MQNTCSQSMFNARIEVNSDDCLFVGINEVIIKKNFQHSNLCWITRFQNCILFGALTLYHFFGVSIKVFRDPQIIQGRVINFYKAFFTSANYVLRRVAELIRLIMSTMGGEYLWSSLEFSRQWRCFVFYVRSENRISNFQPLFCISALKFQPPPSFATPEG